jgi:hypothetical protein
MRNQLSDHLRRFSGPLPGGLSHHEKEHEGDQYDYAEYRRLPMQLLRRARIGLLPYREPKPERLVVFRLPLEIHRKIRPARVPTKN